MMAHIDASSEYHLQLRLKIMLLIWGKETYPLMIQIILFEKNDTVEKLQYLVNNLLIYQILLDLNEDLCIIIHIKA